METLSLNSLVAGRYLLKRPIGGGGMGAVWLAEHVELRAPCAVKLIDREAVRNPEFRRRFTREARAAALLRSTNVVQVLDSGEWRGQPYIVMELLEGEDLRDCLLRTSRLPPHDCVEIARQIARALHKAHGLGIVHRDLKPANVFLTRDDDRLVVKVLDFGIAKYDDADLEGTTDSGAVLGTPHYMSPEQCRGAGQVDHRSDLWSLAVIAFECLTGTRPFPGPHLVNLVHQISVGDLPAPSAVRKGLPASLDAWWQRAARRDPAQRFASARELVEALAQALDVAPLPASSANPTTLAAHRPVSSAPPLLDPTIPQVRPPFASLWTETLKGTGTPPAPGVAPPRPPMPSPVRTSAADLPTKASGIRFANNEPTTRPSAKLPAALPDELLALDAPLEPNVTPAGHTTSAGSLTRTDGKRPTPRAAEGLRSLGLIALGAAGLLAAGGTLARLGPGGAAAGGAPHGASSAALSGAETSAAARPLPFGPSATTTPRLAELHPPPPPPPLEASAPPPSAQAPRRRPPALPPRAPAPPRALEKAGANAREAASKGPSAARTLTLDPSEGAPKPRRPAAPATSPPGAGGPGRQRLLRDDGGGPDEAL